MKILDKAYVLSLILIAVVMAFIGMTAANLGNISVSLGASIASCLSAVMVVIFGLVQWKNK